MGLSNEEIISKVYYAVSQIVDRIDDMKSDAGPYAVREQFAKLCRLGRELWPAMLGGRRNSAHWLLGGDADNEITLDSRGPWATAVMQVCDSHRRTREPGEDEDDHLPALKEEREFDPFNGFFNISGLLDPESRAVYDIYCWTESVTYALRRYDDALSRGMAALDRVISEMQGVCYTIFQRDDHYARAYVLSRVMHAVYTGTRGGYFLDDAGKKLNKINMHHYMSRPMSDDGRLKEIIDYDRELGRKPTLEKRLLVAMKCAGRRFHYDHQFKQLIELFGEEHRALLEPEFKKAQEAHKQREKAGQDSYSSNQEVSSEYAIHGGPLVPWDEEEKQQPPAPKKQKGQKKAKPAPKKKKR